MNSLLRLFIQFFFDILAIIIRLDQFITRKTIKRRWMNFNAPAHDPENYESQIPRLEKYFTTLKGKKWWVFTSGTSQHPKKVPYNEERIKYLNKVFLKAMIILTSEFKGKKTFFAFGSLERDKSLTSSMIDEYDVPSHIELLQAPYRYLATSRGKKLRELTGDLAARVAVMIVTKPRFIYATNPSTLSHFVDELKNKESEIKENLLKLEGTDELAHLLKFADGDARGRLQSGNLSSLFDDLSAVITWDGGYVKSFLDRLMSELPSGIKHVPMYSMSTESIETLPHRIEGKILFLPTMKETLPEFLTSSGELLRPWELKIGLTYSLIISNSWGFERYDTQDEFQVIDMVDHIPALIFKRRRNITASLMGEKITEEQALLLQQMLKDRYPELLNSSLSLFPLLEQNSAGYQMVIVGEHAANEKAVTTDAENYLSEINTEYRDKVKSGRLLPIRLKKMTVRELASLMGQESRWESQFKVMPLYEKPVTKNN